MSVQSKTINLARVSQLQWCCLAWAICQSPPIYHTGPDTLFGRSATPATCLDAWESVLGRASHGKLFMFALKEGIWSYSYSMLLILMKMSTENYLFSWYKAHLFWQIKVWQCVLLSNSKAYPWQIILVSIFSNISQFKKINKTLIRVDISYNYRPYFLKVFPHFPFLLEYSLVRLSFLHWNDLH